MTSPPGAGRRAGLPTLVLLALCACSGGPGGGAPEPPRESLQTLLTHADAAYRDGDFDEAQSAYEEALRVDPANGRVIVNLAQCYLKSRQVRKAEELLAARLATHSDDAAARLVMARVQIRQGALGPAAEALRVVVAAQPDNLVARYNLGFVAYRSRLYDEAETHLRAAIALRPDHAESHYTLGLTSLARGRLPEAIALLEKAVTLAPDHLGARFNLANALARAGRGQEAARAQAAYAELSGRSKARQETETQIATSSVKAVKLQMERLYPEALAEYQALAARFPGHAPLWNEIGRLRVRLGDREGALEALRRATALDPRLSEPHYLLAGLYRQMGDEQAAARAMETFAALETIPEGKSGY
jgi:tetratricopeptide (TPR) repeat protein